MKITYLIAATCNSGGMERVLTQKANWLQRHGHDVTIVTTDQRGRTPFFQLEAGIRTYDLRINYDEDNGRLLSKLVHFPVKQWKHRKRLEALLMQLKADVVVCMFNNDVNLVHKINDGSRKVLEAHFSKNKKLQYGRRGIWALADRWRTRQEERLVRKYDRFVVLTHEDKELWTMHNAQCTMHNGEVDKLVVIPNSGPAPIAKPSSLNAKHSSQNHHRVLAIGRYDYQKGFDTLLNIWEQVVHNSQCGWTLDIIGDGPQREALQQQMERLGLQDSVRLLAPTNKIQEAYLNASIFVMTSRYEGLPMVLLEAQAYGLPIVSFACPCGPRDIITDGINGFLIENRDETLFAQRLTTLMQDAALRQSMGEAAIANAEAYTEERIMQQWESLFSEVVDSNALKNSKS